jgi:hypothetical protein
VSRADAGHANGQRRTKMDRLVRAEKRQSAFALFGGYLEGGAACRVLAGHSRVADLALAAP